MNTGTPTIIVIFGVTGDLTKKKIAPSLYHLHKAGALPERFRIVGFARRDLSDADLKEHISSYTSKDDSFLSMWEYQRGEFATQDDYKALEKKLYNIDGEWGQCSNKLFYLAVPPVSYEDIFNNLDKTKLTEPCNDDDGWTRILVEKPFGKDLSTAQELDVLLGKLFKESQIYRIDHYLAKEMLQNILAFRFANNLFENTWNNNFIERIDIILNETLGVEDRGEFYDGVGALRDVGQNHALQMLSLVTMENPGVFDAESIRSKRANALGMLPRPNVSDTKRFQYDGYRNIKGIDPDSMTETYFNISTKLVGDRWGGVKVNMRGGKKTGEVSKDIIVTFKHPLKCLCPEGEHYRNRVVFSFSEHDTITVDLWAKEPGGNITDIRKRAFTFPLTNPGEKMQYVEEYAKLLLDAIRGDQTLFVSTDEVVSMWKFIDPIVQGWGKGDVPLENYKPNSVPK